MQATCGMEHWHSGQQSVPGMHTDAQAVRQPSMHTDAQAIRQPSVPTDAPSHPAAKRAHTLMCRLRRPSPSDPTVTSLPCGAGDKGASSMRFSVPVIFTRPRLAEMRLWLPDKPASQPAMCVAAWPCAAHSPPPSTHLAPSQAVHCAVVSLERGPQAEVPSIQA